MLTASQFRPTTKGPLLSGNSARPPFNQPVDGELLDADGAVPEARDLQVSALDQAVDLRTRAAQLLSDFAPNPCIH
jgi:hypothetical protein